MYVICFLANEYGLSEKREESHRADRNMYVDEKIRKSEPGNTEDEKRATCIQIRQDTKHKQVLRH